MPCSTGCRPEFRSQRLIRRLRNPCKPVSALTGHWNRLRLPSLSEDLQFDRPNQSHSTLPPRIKARETHRWIPRIVKARNPTLLKSDVTKMLHRFRYTPENFRSFRKLSGVYHKLREYCLAWARNRNIECRNQCIIIYDTYMRFPSSDPGHGCMVPPSRLGYIPG